MLSLSVLISSQLALASCPAGAALLCAMRQETEPPPEGQTTAVAEPTDGQERPGDDPSDGPVFEPAVSLGVQYQSNPYLLTSGESSGVAITQDASLVLNLRGDKIGLALNAAHHLHRYLNPEKNHLDRYLDGSLDLRLELLPQSVVGVDLIEHVSNGNLDTTTWYDSNTALISHMRAKQGALFVARPVDALEAAVGGQLAYDDYQMSQSSSWTMTPSYDPSINSRVGLGPMASIEWTATTGLALSLDGSLEAFRWDENLMTVGMELGQFSTQYGGYLGLPDGRLVQVSSRVQQQLGGWATVDVSLGFTDIAYDEQSVVEDAANYPDATIDGDPNSQGFAKDAAGMERLTAHALFALDLTENQWLTMGYHRGLRDSYFTNYLAYQQVFMRYDALLGARLGVAAEGAYHHESFQGEVTRTDHVVRGRLNGSLSTLDWLSFEGGLLWDQRTSATGNYGIEYMNLGVNLDVKVSF